METCNSVIFEEADEQRRPDRERASRAAGYNLDENTQHADPLGLSDHRPLRRSPFSLRLSIRFVGLCPEQAFRYLTLSSPHFASPHLSFPFVSFLYSTLPYHALPVHCLTLPQLNSPSPTRPYRTLIGNSPAKQVVREAKVAPNRRQRLCGSPRNKRGMVLILQSGLQLRVGGDPRNGLPRPA